MNIVILGRTKPLLDAAKRVYKNGHKIIGIITAPAGPEYSATEKDFEKFAQEINVPFFLKKSLDDEVKECFEAADIGLTMNWISVIEEHHLNWIKLGILNAHMGDLPRYRGNACPNWAIIKGEKEVCLSIHLIEGGKLDVGKIIVQARKPLTPDTYIGDVYDWLESVVPSLFGEAVRLLEKDPSFYIKRASLEDPESFRCFPRFPWDSYIDWNMPVEDIHRLIRSFSRPFDGAFTYLLERGRLRKLHILKARIVSFVTRDIAVAGQLMKCCRDTGEAWIKCGDGILALQVCKYADEKTEFSPGRRWKSIRKRLGITYPQLIEMLMPLL